MTYFTAIAEATEAGLFVVFAHIWCEICDCDRADVCWCFDRADCPLGGVRVLLNEGLVARSALVDAVALLYIRSSNRRSRSRCAQQILRIGT